MGWFAAVRMWAFCSARAAQARGFISDNGKLKAGLSVNCYNDSPLVSLWVLQAQLLMGAELLA